VKKILSTLTALMTCLALTIPALAVGGYAYIRDPWTGGYIYATGPWSSNASYVVRPWEGNYTYVAPSSPSYSYIYNTWAPSTQGLSNFQRVRTYTSGVFKDVPAGAWYEEGVRTLYEMGITAESSSFRPKSGLTLGEVVSLAVRLHSTYNGWSVPAGMTELQYALNMGIVTDGQYDNYSAPATRRSFAAIMAKALPSAALRGINVIMDGAIPDVPLDDPGAWGIYTLYRAGALVGSDPWGTFCPNDKITRASAAVITARMLDSSQRQGASLFTAQTSDISLSQTSLVLYPGQSRTLTAYVYPVNAVNRNVSWASSAPSVATVDAYGTVTAHRAGTAVITATTAYGTMNTCTVQVVSGF